jgi:hypothetical protein
VPVDYNSLESCQNEIVRLEREVAALRAEARGGGTLPEPPDDATASLIHTRLQRCLELEQQNASLVAELGRINRHLSVELVRGRLLAADSARRIASPVFRGMVEQTEQQAASGRTSIDTADLMVLLTAIEPTPDAGGR